MLAYTRQIENLNIFLSLIGKVPINSKIHSRVAICSLYQNVSRNASVDAYMLNADSYEKDYVKQIGNVGKLHPEYLKALTSNDENVPPSEDFDSLELKLPSFWKALGTEVQDFVSFITRKDSTREILPEELQVRRLVLCVCVCQNQRVL